MASELSVLVDDDSGDFMYSGGEWTLSTLAQWYKATSWFPAFAQSGTDFGTFSLNFEGTSVAFIGNTPGRQLSQIAEVSIDGGAPTNFSYGDNSPESYMQWYKSPTLSAGKHSITVSHLATTSVDFAVIKVAQNTTLSGKTIIVDNENSAISYSPGWRKTATRFDAGQLRDGYPYGGSTHWSSAVGDTITFRFTGTSISLYGLFNWANIGTLSVTYTLDGSTEAQIFSVTRSSPEFVRNEGEASNFLLYSRDSLAVGDHTLVVTITRGDNQEFMLDYITYIPSFETLTSMPNLPVGPVANPDPTSGASTGTSAGPVGRTTVVTGSNGVPITTISTPTGSGAISTTAGAPTSYPVGAIVGGIVGGLGVLILAVFLFFWLRRRESNSTGYGVTPDAIDGGASYPSSGPIQERLSPNRVAFVNPPLLNGTVIPFRVAPPAHQGLRSMHDLKRECLDSNQGGASSPATGRPGDRANVPDTRLTSGPASGEAAPPSYETVLS